MTLEVGITAAALGTGVVRTAGVTGAVALGVGEFATTGPE
jgi:hypothetical protein